MSRNGNGLDIAPMKLFFGHFKDEVDATTCKTVAELKRKIEDYMVYYNSTRYKWGLKEDPRTIPRSLTNCLKGLFIQLFFVCGNLQKFLLENHLHD
jgi:Integrase core domain